MSNSFIAIITEGQKYEIGVFNSLYNSVLKYLNNTAPKYITLPASANIYMLWKIISADVDVDIIEVIRENCEEAAKELKGYSRNDFSEIYLFFDFDAHQDNLPSGEDANSVLYAMLETFNNETENGKLFISYPMAEAIRDFVLESCEAFNGSCCIPYRLTNYKEISGDGNKMSSVKNYKKRDWQNVLLCFRNRLSRLLNQNLSMKECKTISPSKIFDSQIQLINEQSTIVVLSAFPEYFIDYYRLDIIESFLEGKDIICSKSCY